MGRKEIRQKKLFNIIKERCYIPPTKELASLLNVTERTIRNDIAEINEGIPKVATDELRQIVLLRLRSRALEMKDSDLIKLAEFFLAKKSEVKGELAQKIVVQMWEDDENGSSLQKEEPTSETVP